MFSVRRKSDSNPDARPRAFTPGQSVPAPPRMSSRRSIRGGANTLCPGVLSTVALLIGCTFARADTIPGSAIAVRSDGNADGDAWTMRGNGFVGTYVRLAAPGEVRVRITAADAFQFPRDDGAVSRMISPALLNVVIGDERVDLPLPDDKPATFDHSFALPAGTHFIRVQRANDVRGDRLATIASLSIDGADVLNAHTDANALAAADTYIETGRRASVAVTLPGVAAGTVVHVRQRRLAFDVGGNASGARNVLLAADAPAGSDAANFQAFVAAHFTTLVPSNAGKWSNNEDVRGTSTMEYVDAVTAFAKAHGMHVRMHNLIWDSPQQPKWALDLLDAAANGDAKAKAELRRAISDRIAYYVRDRSRGYQELDVLNESEHKPKYLKAFGVEGVAAIYAEAAAAIRAAGSDARTFVNEYNLLQYSQDPTSKASDPFANWYREHVEALNANGANVGGFGVQYYADARSNTREPHSAARIQQVFQNLAITGLPVSLTEFGMKAGGDEATNERVLDETLRMTFGTPGATGFLFFGFWEKAMWDQAPAAMLVDKAWKLTPLGEAFARTMARWRTELDATVDAGGAIRFTGFAGDYDLVVSGETRRLTIVRGATAYDVPR